MSYLLHPESPTVALAGGAVLTGAATPISELIHMIRPPLHHLAALGEVLRPVIRGSDLVALPVGELALDDVRVEAELVQHCRSRGAESVSGRSAVVPHPVEGVEDGVLRHRLLRPPLVRKEETGDP